MENWRSLLAARRMLIRCGLPTYLATYVHNCYQLAWEEGGERMQSCLPLTGCSAVNLETFRSAMHSGNGSAPCMSQYLLYSRESISYQNTNLRREGCRNGKYCSILG